MFRLPIIATDDAFFGPCCRQFYDALIVANAHTRQSPPMAIALKRVATVLSAPSPDITAARCAIASLHGALSVANPTLALDRLFQFSTWPDEQLRGLLGCTVESITLSSAGKCPVPFELPQPATGAITAGLNLGIHVGDDITLAGAVRTVKSLDPTTGLYHLVDPTGELPTIEISGPALERRLDEEFDRSGPVGPQSKLDRGMNPFTPKRLDNEPAE